jgi:DNA-binding response OmpR family regulator
MSPTDAPQRPVRILLVDDDPQIIEALASFFQLYDWTVLTALRGEEALDIMNQERDLDAVLLDVHMPGLSGLDVLQRSQKAGIVAPVIMISTSAEDTYRLRALGLGAEDYLTKPFEPDALKERIEAVIGLGHRPELRSDARHRVGELMIDLERSVGQKGADEIRIPDAQRDLLRVLLQNRGRAVSRKRLLQEALGIDQETITFTMTLRVLYDMLDKHVSGLRELVEPDPAHPKVIERVFGQGYRLRA